MVGVGINHHVLSYNYLQNFGKGSLYKVMKNTSMSRGLSDLVK